MSVVRNIMRPSFALEQNHDGFVIGVDEVGRGPLAGPVVAAAVLFHSRDVPESVLACIRDSKTLSPAKRQQAMRVMRPYIHVGFGAASRHVIDQINILQASLLAMQRAVMVLMRHHVVDHALIDGVHCPDLVCSATPVIGGDRHSLSIAAASIYAKEMRDAMMARLSLRYPDFAWDRNAGYGTAAHLQGMKMNGISPHHRLSFRPVADCLREFACAS